MNFYQIFHENKDLWKWIDLRDIFGRLNAKLLASRGYRFSTADDNLDAFFREFAKKSKLQRKIEQICYKLPSNEYVIVGFDHFSEKNYWPIFLPTANLYRTFPLFEYDYLAEITILKEIYHQKIRRFYRFETWTADIIQIRDVYSWDRIYVPYSSIPYEIPPELKKSGEKLKNPFGLIPFHDFRNHSWKNDNDWENLAEQIRQLNEIFEFLSVELKINRRLVFARLNEEAKLASVKNVEQKQKMPDFIISGIQGNADDHKIQIVNSTISWAAIQGAIDAHLRRIFDLLGYSYSYFAGQAVASDILTTNSAVASAIKLKRRNFNADMTLFLDKIFTVAGFKNAKYKFELIDSTNLSEEQFLRLEFEKIKNGISSRKSLLAKFNLSNEEIKNELKHADKDSEFQIAKNPTDSRRRDPLTPLKTQTKPQGIQNQPAAKPVTKPLETPEGSD